MTSPNQPDPDTGTDEPDEPDQAAEDTEQTFDRAYVERLRREAATHRTTARRATAELERVRAASMSESERLLDEARRQAAEEAAAPLRRQLAQLQVATAKKVPAELATRLVGDTPEELAADADRLMTALGLGEAQQPARVGGFAGGAKPSVDRRDMNSVIRRAAGLT
jgi:hypothetical protein